MEEKVVECSRHKVQMEEKREKGGSERLPETIIYTGWEPESITSRTMTQQPDLAARDRKWNKDRCC